MKMIIFFDERSFYCMKYWVVLIPAELTRDGRYSLRYTHTNPVHKKQVRQTFCKQIYEF